MSTRKLRWRVHRLIRRFHKPYDEIELYDVACSREWHAEGVGLLACDLAAGHEGDHVSFYGGGHDAPNLDAADPFRGTT